MLQVADTLQLAQRTGVLLFVPIRQTLERASVRLPLTRDRFLFFFSRECLSFTIVTSGDFFFLAEYIIRCGA